MRRPASRENRPLASESLPAGSHATPGVCSFWLRVWGTNAADGLLPISSLPNPKSQMPLITRMRRRRGMTFLARIRRRLQQMGPYPSLVLLLVPLLLVEPLKLVAVFVAGKGHWLTGTGMLVAAYAASLLVVERLFRVVKPKLMILGWFARMWTWVVTLRNKLFPWASKTTLDASGVFVSRARVGYSPSTDRDQHRL